MLTGNSTVNKATCSVITNTSGYPATLDARILPLVGKHIFYYPKTQFVMVPGSKLPTRYFINNDLRLYKFGDYMNLPKIGIELKSLGPKAAH